MSRMLYLEGCSGIAGDMTVAALLELGGSREKLDAALKSLPIDGFTYDLVPGKSHGIAGSCFKVYCQGGDHEVHHHHDHHHNDDHDHAHHHHHDHDHEHHHHAHHHHEHEHCHRNLSDILSIIEAGDLSVRAKALAGKIFGVVAEAEATAHGCPIDEVHFHEVGAVDSIVDIVAAAVLIDDLDIAECVVESLSEGRGFVRCQHGELPVPVPAVLNIASRYNITLHRRDVQGEMVTPTGIAIAAALRTRETLPEKYRVAKVGIGVGKREFNCANILRAMIIEDISAQEKNNSVWVLESNIDDSTGEMLALALEKLLANGALDAHFEPCFMKKNRPGYLLKVLARESDIESLEHLIFENTTTIGIRRYAVERSCMQRESVEITTAYGKVQAKKCVWQDITRIYPEYESVKEIAELNNVSFKQVWDAVIADSQKH